MDCRVVLGSGVHIGGVAGALADDATAVRVVTDAESVAETARGDGVEVTVADPTDPDVLAEVGPVRGVVVADADPGTARACVRAAREAFGTPPVVAYRYGDGLAWAELDADRVLDPTGVVADRLLEASGTEAGRMRRLRSVLRGIDRLAVVTHDNPDPDAIASAVALCQVCEGTGCAAEVYYYGAISHQENRALVNLLDFELTRLDPGADPDCDGVALVDHSRPGVNDGLSPDVEADIVVDHHPPRGPVDGRYVDLRTDAGATSTVLVEYLDRLGVEPGQDLATGLLFGVRTDTREFTRGVSATDFEAAAKLLPAADLGTLDKVESPSIGTDTFETIAAAIRNRHLEDGLLVTSVGRLSDRDALAQAADRLVDMEGVLTAVVYGVQDGTVHVSARSRDPDLDMGEALRDAFGRIGSAGGHADMAGAQVRLGVLEAVEDREESLLAVVEEFVTERLQEAVAGGAGRTGGPAVPLPGEVDEEFPLGEGGSGE